jgi:AcrR family transcriptional regulator
VYDTHIDERVKRQSPLRLEQAAQTRRRILEAAAAVFAEQGFGGARIEDVADRAGVAVPTVYKGFVNKSTLLVEALGLALRGGVDGRVDQQAWFTEQLEEPDPRRQLRLVARNARRLCERAGSLLGVLRAAAALDDTLERAWREIADDRAARSRRTAINLVQKADAQVRLDRAELAATLSSLTDPQLFVTYTSGSRSADQYEAWLADVLCRTILE